MHQVCIMSGHAGYLGSQKKVFLTLMGVCELQCPTIARQILSQKQQPRGGSGPRPQQVFFTVMGSTAIKVATLAQEFVDFTDMLRNGDLSLADWDRCIADIDRSDVIVKSFTLMGGFSDSELPTENEEIDALALQCYLGIIPDQGRQILLHGIGLRGSERRAAVRRAVVAVT